MEPFLAELQSRLAAASTALRRIEELGELPPATTAADVELLLDWRARLRLHGPVVVGTPGGDEKIGDAASRLLAPLPHLGHFARKLIEQSEYTIQAAGVETGAAIGGDVLKSAYGRRNDDGDTMFLPLDSLPGDHPIREQLPAAECFQQRGTPLLVLGWPRFTEFGIAGIVFTAERWYATAAVVSLTRQWRAKQREQEQAKADYERRQELERQRQLEADPAFRAEQLERRLAALESRGGQ